LVFDIQMSEFGENILLLMKALTGPLKAKCPPS